MNAVSTKLYAINTLFELVENSNISSLALCLDPVTSKIFSDIDVRILTSPM